MLDRVLATHVLVCPVYICCCSIVINSTPFTQKDSGLVTLEMGCERSEEGEEGCD